MNKYVVVLGLLLLCFVFSRCRYDNVEGLELKKEGYDCDTIYPSYSNDIVPIIISYCSDPAFGSCHQDNSQNTHLNNYTELKFLVDGGHVQEHVVNRHEMPPPYSLGPKSLPEELIKKIDCWIKHGAANN